MARPRQRSIVTRLADVGEDAMQRLGGAPGADRVLGSLNSMRERVDDMQKKLRGLDAMEKRVKAIERRLDKLEGKGTTSATARKRSSSTSARSKKPSDSEKPSDSG